MPPALAPLSVENCSAFMVGSGKRVQFIGWCLGLH